jgi:hypothetical protein
VSSSASICNKAKKLLGHTLFPPCSTQAPQTESSEIMSPNNSFLPCFCQILGHSDEKQTDTVLEDHSNLSLLIIDTMKFMCSLFLSTRGYVSRPPMVPLIVPKLIYTVFVSMYTIYDNVNL